MDTLISSLYWLAGLAAAAIWVWVLFEMYNSPEGERYLRRRMQGAFVPFSDDATPAESTRAR